MTRSDIQVLIDAIQDGVPNTALKVRNVLNEIADGIHQTGDVKQIDVNNAYITANFDGTGLGINEREGWAICNGNNGTRDRHGRTQIGWGNNYPTMGATGGSATHTLSISEMPVHTHGIRGSTSTSGGSGQNVVNNVSNNTGDVTTKSEGGGQPHNNMQPYIVTLFIQKL